MSIDLKGKSAYPEVNAQRDRLRTLMEKLEKEGNQGSRKYKKAEKALRNLQIMNFVPPGGMLTTPAEFSKTASDHFEEAKLASFVAIMQKVAVTQNPPPKPKPAPNPMPAPKPTPAPMSKAPAATPKPASNNIFANAGWNESSVVGKDPHTGTHDYDYRIGNKNTEKLMSSADQMKATDGSWPGHKYDRLRNSIDQRIVRQPGMTDPQWMASLKRHRDALAKANY